MIDIPDFRISMDLFPQHDDLQKLKVDNIGRYTHLPITKMGSPSRDINFTLNVPEAKSSNCPALNGGWSLAIGFNLKFSLQGTKLIMGGGVIWTAF
jgi:hypothetical protein